MPGLGYFDAKHHSSSSEIQNLHAALHFVTETDITASQCSPVLSATSPEVGEPSI
jgi:hypothetical protein